MAARSVAAALSLASGVYAVIVAAHAALFAAGIFRAHRAEAKVVSVGNLTLGGTGKTPFTAMLARLIREKAGRKPAVLIRGYGRDEQSMLREQLGDVPLIVGRDRVAGAREAARERGADVLILDDGFQHRALARDLDIVLVDTRDPFGNERLFPRGILREPVSGIRRAHVVVLTKADRSLVDPGSIRGRLSALNGGALFLEAVHAPAYLWDLATRKRMALDTLKGKKTFLVSGIGDPGYFEATVRGLGAEVVGHRAFPDHHVYRESDVRLVAEAARAADLAVTTEKDAVKLESLDSVARSGLIVAVVHVDMTITHGEGAFIARLTSVLSR